MKFVLGSIASVALVAGAAQATTFSFASDNDHTSYTWRGNGALIRNAQDPADPMLLVIDDENGPAPSLTYAVDFRATFQLTPSAPLDLGGGRVLHSYGIVGVPESGSFGFYLPSGAPLLLATFTGGNMSSLGTASAWGTSGGVQATDIAGQVTYTWFGPDMPEYGLFNGASSMGLDDAAFTLTSLNSNGNPGVTLGDSNLPNAEWFAEGSYSGTARFVPAPGALGLLGLGTLVVSRRKR